ncbi:MULTISPECIES: ABC transporter permease [unclassified Brevibacterium]|uniref:ABC transporter permease n=1 Tax=unclassified Brevibacterium TaxID=2614124 RepID=UPI001E45FF93|nr:MULTISPECIES: ABC transporter permease [unclassified Brevibacterium]MCD1286903.1 nickel ABC transporter permease [Brevibacterium sp. CCUG 69071]MDK8433859.1 ABC transporter permease [Brevibacterium sp. H-BE7]
MSDPLSSASPSAGAPAGTGPGAPSGLGPTPDPSGKPPRTRGGTAARATPQARFALPLPAFLRRHNLQLWTGLIILGAMVLLLAIGPLFVTADPNRQDLLNAFGGSSAAHPLGTDQLGRDILARFLHGGRIDLLVAVIAVIVPFILGTALGALAGYFGRWVDIVIMRLADIVSAFPFYVLVIVLVFVMGNGMASIFVAISAVSWVAYARIVRGEVLVLREEEFVSACRASGLTTPRILSRHVIPNTVSQGIIYAMSDIVLNIGVVVTLSFFGLGIVPPTADWGQMMNDGQQYMGTGNYGLILWPGFAVVLVSLALALIGDGLTNILKPRR